MWVKIDDGFATHPKILSAGPLAALIQIRAICFASQNQTDGFIYESAVGLLFMGFERIGLDEGRIGDYASFGSQADEIDWPALMVEHGLWETRPNGYYIHDYLEWNLSKKDRESFIKQKSKAGKKGMKARWTQAKRVITGVITDDITKPYHAISTSTSSLSSLKSSLSSLDSEFEQFWNCYPRKVGKKAASKAFRNAFQNAQDRPRIDDLLAAIHRAKGSPQWAKDGGQFIPHPATWLNRGQWADVPTETKPTVFEEFLARGGDDDAKRLDD